MGVRVGVVRGRVGRGRVRVGRVWVMVRVGMGGVGGMVDRGKDCVNVNIFILSLISLFSLKEPVRRWWF
jgi:hypothetical protein